MNAHSAGDAVWQRGFTMVELITVMVIIGVLSAIALPRFFNRNTFDSRGFYDQTISTLRFAQKMAVAQHRFVCVALTASSISLTLDPTPPGSAYTAATCPGVPLTSPSGQTPYIINAPGGVTLGGVVNFYFNALGVPSTPQNITVSGYATPITVTAGTGYVY